jgi:hypothetical protein
MVQENGIKKVTQVLFGVRSLMLEKILVMSFQLWQGRVIFLPEI